MSVDFQQLHQQVKQLGDRAKLRERRLSSLRNKASDVLNGYADKQAQLSETIDRVIRSYEPNLRCARPVHEPLNSSFPCPPVPNNGTLIAADGSQINPDRHAEVDYCLINVGAIQAELGAVEAPQHFVWTDLFYDEQLYTSRGSLTEGMLALLRDLGEREALAALAAAVEQHPVITFTDGPLELWGARESDRMSSFQEKLDAYLGVLENLRDLNITTAGYVDKPGANLVLRLLEVALTPESNLKNIREQYPLRGASDRRLFQDLLPPGHRSAVFAIQANSAAAYRDELSLHFFYVNVGRADHPHLARVEIPAWVVADNRRLQDLHSVLVNQCRILGTRPYPYLLHRAHETAVVTLAEKEQVTQMITMELRRQGVKPEGISAKQAVKNLVGVGRYR
jgi:hypothetical protein